MKSNRLSIFVAIAITFVLFLLGGQPAHAASCAVPSVSYPTIQAAVNDTNCNAINVAAGTFNEQVRITRTVALRGAQASVDARTRTGAESIITNACGPVQIMADNVVLNGFTIQGSTSGDPCYVAGIWMHPGQPQTQGGAQILNNIIQNNIFGIELDSTCVYSTLVQRNWIRDNNNSGPGSGYGIETNFGLCNAQIDSNKFSGHANGSLRVLAASSGVTVSNNELVGGTPEGIALIHVSNSSITANTSIGSNSDSTIDLYGADSNIAISHNVLLAGRRGVRVEDPFASGANSGISADSNCLGLNRTAGLEVDTGGHSGTLNAENNWWANPTGPSGAGPGAGDAVVDPDSVVDFSPWLTVPPSGLACPITPRVNKQSVLSALTAFRSQVTNKNARRSLNQAIKHLQSSLTASRWKDDNQLHLAGGANVFDDEKAAVVSLTALAGSSALTPAQKNKVQKWTKQLVAADQALAQIAIDVATGGNPQELDQAKSQLKQGDNATKKGKYDSAIQDYRNAWQHAINA